MVDFSSLPDADICAVIAIRLKTERLRGGMSQLALSEKSGIPLRTYKRFEATGRGQIDTLVAVLRALNRLRLLEVLLPPPAIEVRDSLAGKVGRMRKRACKGT